MSHGAPVFVSAVFFSRCCTEKSGGTESANDDEDACLQLLSVKALHELDCAINNTAARAALKFLMLYKLWGDLVYSTLVATASC